MERRRTPDRRRAGPTPRFPFRDRSGHWVMRDRRVLADRRLNQLPVQLFHTAMSLLQGGRPSRAA